MMDLLSNPKTNEDTISAMVERGEITWDEVHDFILDDENKDWWNGVPNGRRKLNIILGCGKNESSPK